MPEEKIPKWADTTPNWIYHNKSKKALKCACGKRLKKGSEYFENTDYERFKNKPRGISQHQSGHVGTEGYSHSHAPLKMICLGCIGSHPDIQKKYIKLLNEGKAGHYEKGNVKVMLDEGDYPNYKH